MRTTRWVAGLVGVTVALAVGPAAAEEADVPAWFDDWGIEEGFRITEDVAGLRLPTALAFVPSPGTGGDDVLYYVTELTGSIKAVTNDRRVHQFGTVPAFEREETLPVAGGEGGLAGICLDDAGGHVFVTFTYHDDDGLLRNGLVRFDSEPDRFGLAPIATHDFSSVLASALSALSHQIGGCQVVGGALYVSVGDGGDPSASGDVSVPLGKVLRFTLDGEPHPENPFSAQGEPASLTWAYGLRNPFGIHAVDGDLYVADNGTEIDRFLQVEEGEDYLWNGSDRSIAARADVVWPEAIGPGAITFLPTGALDWPAAYGDSFYITATADRRDTGGIYRLRFDLAAGHALDQPHAFVRALAPEPRTLAAIALGPDGLYFAAVRPDESGTSSVLRISYDPSNQHPHRTEALDEDGPGLLRRYGCLGCHSLGGEGGTEAPALDQNSLRTRAVSRFASPAYRELVAELDRLEEEPFVSWRSQRQQVLEAGNEGEMLRLWVQYRIQEPKFDDPDAQMPNLAVPPRHAAILSDYLTGEGSPPLLDRVTAAVLSREGLALISAGALGASGLWAAGLLWARSRRRSGRSRIGLADESG